MIATFFDGATFCDGARFSTPPVSAIITARPRLKVLYDGVSGAAERERTFSDLGGTPAGRNILFEQTEGGGSQIDVWLSAEPGQVTGWFDANSWRGPMLPLRWSPVRGLEDRQRSPGPLTLSADATRRRSAPRWRRCAPGRGWKCSASEHLPLLRRPGAGSGAASRRAPTVLLRHLPVGLPPDRRAGARRTGRRFRAWFTRRDVDEIRAALHPALRQA